MAGLLNRALRDAGREEGVGVITALMITLVVFALGATWTKVAVHEVEITSFEAHREQALHAAEAGVHAAIAELITDPDYTGTTIIPVSDDGEYEVTVAKVNPLDPNDLRRMITAKGYSPAKGAARAAGRQIEQQVTLLPEPGSGTAGSFDWALFGAPNGITSGNSVVSTGDVYARSNLNLVNSQKIFGDAVSLGSVTIENSGTIGGDLKAAGNITLVNSATIEGNVEAGGSVTMQNSAKVLGNVRAGGAVVMLNSAVVEGTVTQFSAPPPPPDLAMPTFTWTPANYTAPQTWSTAASFKTHWNSNRNSFSGHHRITQNATLTIDKDTKFSGDTTIVSDGPIRITRDLDDVSSSGVDLVIISLADANPAIELTNSVTPPASITTLIYAPNGTGKFANSIDLHGAVYAEGLEIGNSFSVTWASISPPGFTFSNGSGGAASRYDVNTDVLREVPLDS